MILVGHPAPSAVWVASGVLAMSLGAVTCGHRSTAPSSGATTPTATSSGTPTPMPGVIPPCGGTTAFFDVLPVALGDFLAFRPLGFLSPPIHMFPAKHSAFSMTPPGQTAVPRPVRAPGKVWVKEIWEASFSSGGRNYQLFVYPCSEVRVYFGHVASISSRLTTEMQRVAPSCNSFFDGTSQVTTCRHENMAVPLESGEEFGAGPDSAGVDFGLIDFRRTPSGFVRLDHYDYYYGYYAAPLDYFQSNVRSQLASKTGDVFGRAWRTASPVGGTYMQDVAGTAQGNWFLPGVYHANSTDLSRSLGLASDYVDPSQPIMAVGTSIVGMNMGLYSFTVAGEGSTNRAFRDVTPDGTVYCYENFLTGQSRGGLPLSQPPGVVLMGMPTDATLQVELVFGGSCASAPRAFTRATTFER